MAGIIARFQFMGVTAENGYAEIHHVAGGPNDTSNPEFPQGQWVGFIYYYTNLEYRQRGINNNLPIESAEFTQLKTQYVPGSDPYDAFLVMLQQWFPDGKVVK